MLSVIGYQKGLCSYVSKRTLVPIDDYTNGMTLQQIDGLLFACDQDSQVGRLQIRLFILVSGNWQKGKIICTSRQQAAREPGTRTGWANAHIKLLLNSYKYSRTLLS